ncbi:MAG: tRNA dihydrouridine synthase DusB [Planctomycetes bacterium]|nr:tRNA dihydrouridine synthase DusB [Planctomycetota bacterium]
MSQHLANPVPPAKSAPSFSIGNVIIPGRLALAPMAGFSNTAYRVLARRYGASLTTTEMVSARALAVGNEKTRRLLDRADDETPAAAQVFGNDPESLSESTRIVADLGFQIVDVNMGCPVPKITSGGAGCALMNQPADAARVMERMVRSSPIPVTVKIRAGWSDAHKNAPEVARALESAGVAALTVHGRTREQLYTGRADRRLIAEVKSNVHIPVFGNGDVDSPAEALDMFQSTGVDGIAIARGALGRPWIFQQIEAMLAGAQPPAQPSPAEIGGLLLELMEGVVTLYGETTGMRMMRRLAADFSRGVPGGARFREGCVRVCTREGLISLTRAHFHFEGDVPPSPVPPPKDGPLPLPEPGGG